MKGTSGRKFIKIHQARAILKERWRVCRADENDWRDKDSCVSCEMIAISFYLRTNHHVNRVGDIKFHNFFKT